MKTITLEREIYSKEVLLRTAYSFTDRVYMHLAQDDTHWIVKWEPKGRKQILPAEFENELILQQTRMLLEQKTADLRKMIIARALASTIIDITTPESSTEEMMDDDEADTILKGWHKTHDTV